MQIDAGYEIVLEGLPGSGFVRNSGFINNFGMKGLSEYEAE